MQTLERLTSPEPLGRRDDPVLDARLRIRRTARSIFDWIKRHAAKKIDLLELDLEPKRRGHGMRHHATNQVKMPLAYNKDLQNAEPLFNAADTVLSLLPLVTGFMLAVEFDLKKMEHDAKSGFMNAWTAAAYLVERGVPARLAHEAVGKAVQQAADRGCDLQDLPLANLQAINPAFKSDFPSHLGLPEVLALHDVPGGTAPRHVKRALQNARERAAALRVQESVAAR